MESTQKPTRDWRQFTWGERSAGCWYLGCMILGTGIDGAWGLAMSAGVAMVGHALGIAASNVICQCAYMLSNRTQTVVCQPAMPMYPLGGNASGGKVNNN